MDAARASAQVVDGVELVLFPGTEPMPNYGVTDPEAIAWMSERLTPTRSCASSSRCGWRTRRRCGRSRRPTSCARWTLPSRDPARMASAAEAGRVRDVDTGHDLMITEPKAVADLLLRVADV